MKTKILIKQFLICINYLKFMKNAFISCGFILLFVFILHGFTIEKFLWYLCMVIVMTPILYIFDKYLMKPIIREYFNFSEEK